jgi:hypothetical protein
MNEKQGELKVKRWVTVFVYATAMAWVESAVVYYLRTMFHRIEPYQEHPLPLIGGLGPAELVREAATLVMLLAVGILAGKSWRSRLGYAAVAFGVWDIFYYVFLKVMCDWPHSLMDWDILFLIPVPWWGPVWAPVSISMLMILWGTIVSTWEGNGRTSQRWGGRKPVRAGMGTEEFVSLLTSSPAVYGLSFVGMLLALYAFMANALQVAGQGVVALRNVLPQTFNWPVFVLGLLLMSAPILRAVRGLRLESRETPALAGIP